MQEQELLKQLTEQTDLKGLMAQIKSILRNQANEIIGLNLSKMELTNEQIHFLWKLEQLEGLNLSENGLSKLTIPKGMKKLRYLNLCENPSLRSLTFEAGLPALERLDLSECKLDELTLPSGFEVLNTLEAQDSQLTGLTIEGDCPCLMIVDLSGNKISVLNMPTELPALELLYLQGGNQVSDIGFLNKSSALQTLNLNGNEISDLSPIRHLLDTNIPFKWEKSGNGVLVDDCPLTSPPPEIVEQGNDAIRNWFEANKKDLNEIKVLLVGEAKAGKTSLLRRLKFNIFNPDEEQTDGIIIEDFDFEKLPTFKKQKSLHGTKAYFWDFGGQEIMSSTHQFFMTKRSVYLLILEARKDANADQQVRQWLQRIQAFGGKSQVIVVVNKIELNRAFGLDTVSLQKEFPQIKGFISISCKSGENIERLQDILESFIPESELFSTRIDEKWLTIKEELQKRTREKYYISHSEFREICKGHNLKDEASQLQAIRFLNDLGIVLHFDEIDLGEYFVLDPYWVTSGVYRIITSDAAARQKGEIELDQLKYIVNEEQQKIGEYIPENHREIEYSPFELRYLANIMSQFKLSFFLQGQKKMLIPELLDKKTPSEESLKFLNATEKLQLVYSYDYLPPSVMPRLMVEMRKDIVIPWRTGVILKCESSINGEAMVTSSGNEIKIIVTGDHRQKRDYMSTIRYFLDKINEEFDIEIRLLIPLPDHDDYFVAYENLLKMEKAGRKEYENWDLEVNFKISILLDGIVRIEEVKRVVESHKIDNYYVPETPLRKIKIFLASSAELENDRKDFEIFIGRENKEYIDIGKFLELIIWEDFIDALSKTRLQDEYNKSIKGCDIFISLFATKVGEFTLEEFETAFGQFKTTNKPLVYTYFKDVPLSTETIDIKDITSLDTFKKKLKSLGHFRSKYKNIDDLLRQVKNQLYKIFKNDLI